MQLEGGFEVLGRRRLHAGQLGAAELAQQRRADVGRRGLGQGTAQRRDRLLRGALAAHGASRPAAGRRPPTDRPRPAGWPADARPPARATRRARPAGRAARAWSRPRAAVPDGLGDRRAHERMAEAEHGPGREQVGAGEPRGGVGRGVRIEARERRGQSRVGAVAEDHHRPRQRLRVRPQGREAAAQGQADALGHDGVDLRRGGPRGLDAARRQLGRELAEQERVAAGPRPARLDEGAVGGLSEAPLQEPRRARRRAAARAAPSPWRARRAPRRGRPSTGSPGAQRGDDGDGQPLQAAGQVGEEPQGRVVAPVDVVDGDQQRPPRGERDDQPVQRVRGRRRLRVAELVAGDVEHRRGAPRGPAELVASAHRGLQQLAGDAERQVALELARACHERPHPVGLRGVHGEAQELRLADPGRPFEDRRAAVARGGRGQEPVERPLLAVALEEQAVHGAMVHGERGKGQGRPGTRRGVRARQGRHMLSTDPALDAHKATTLQTFDVMAAGELEDFAAVVHPDFFNHEQRDEPPATRGPRLEQIHGVAAMAARRVRPAALGAARDRRRGRPRRRARHDGRPAHGGLRRLRRRGPRRHGVRADGPAVRHHADALAAPARRPDGRALGAARRLRHRRAARLERATPRYLLRCALAKRRAVRAADPPQRAQERPFGPWLGRPDEAKAVALPARGAHARRRRLQAFDRVYDHDARTRRLVLGPPLAAGSGPRRRSGSPPAG